MIFVERTKCPKSLDLADETSAASKELAAAKAYFDEHHEPPAASTFHAYSRDDVRRELIAMFHGKCAYCETDTVGGSDGDIEHYRPKGGVSDATAAGVAHDGYWWLAMDWTNLVLSCMHCNQERRQLGLEPGATVDEIRKAIAKNDRRLSGKKNAFPTADKLWGGPYDVSAEQPLLVDPTLVDPEPLFEWIVAGEFSTIRAKDGSAQADKTWRVLGLNRRGLTESRGKMLTTLNLLAQNVRCALENVGPGATKEEAEAARDAALPFVEILKSLCAGHMPYAGLARSYLKRVEAMMEPAA